MPLNHLRSLQAIVISVVLGGSATAQAASLADIYKLALSNDAEYKAAQANLAVGQKSLVIGRSGLLPQVNARASVSDSTVDESRNAFTLQNNSAEREFETTTLSAQLDQPLFNLAAWHDYKRGKISTSIAAATFNAAEQALIIRTARAYFDSLRAHDELETAIAEEQALAQSLEQTQQRFEVGLTAITEVHEAQASFDSAKANRLLREGGLIIALEALELITGQSQQQVAPLKDDFPVTPPTPNVRSEWVETALKANIDLITAKLQRDDAKENYKAARADHLPTLSAQISYSDSETTEAGIDFPREETAVAVILNVPIFSGLRTSALRQQAAHNKVSAQETLTFTERRVVQAVRTRYQEVKTGVANVEARRQAIVSSESALEATKAGYDVGTRNLVNVLDAQRRVYAARGQFLTALYEYILSSLALKQAAGTLNAEDIKQLDQWLNKKQLVGLGAE